ncbi:MAG: hypothetical protein WKG07_30115 [Hymenobacter sp.]
MPYKERDIDKQYFTIGEVAEQFGVADVAGALLGNRSSTSCAPRKQQEGQPPATPQADVTCSAPFITW